MDAVVDADRGLSGEAMERLRKQPEWLQSEEETLESLGVLL